MTNRIVLHLVSLAFQVVAQWITLSMAGVLEPAFSWALNDTTIVAEVPQCSQIPMHLIVLNKSSGLNIQNNDLGTPPYFLIAAMPNGASIIGALGSNPYNLIWEVSYPSGTKFLPLVIDAHGNSGGVQNTIFIVTEGSSGCLPHNTPETRLILSANVSSSVNDPIDACEPIDFTIAGGTPPYTVSIAALNQTVTNVTLDSDATLTWFSTANPNSEFIAIVSDANGPGRGTGLFKTSASDLRPCPGPSLGDSNNNTTLGTPSTSLTRSEPSETSLKLSEASKSPVTVGTIVGAAIGAVFVSCIGVAVLLRCYYRRRRYGLTKLRADQRVGGLIDNSDNNGSHHRDHRQISENIATTSDSTRPASVTLSLRSGHTITAATIASSIRDGWRNMRTMIQHRDAGDMVSDSDIPPPYRDRRIVRDGTGTTRLKVNGSRVRSRRNEDAGSSDFSPEAIHHQM